jgi:DNA-binding transcriptional LysR family regulator
MNIDTLNCYVILAESQSFTEAAVLAHITLSAMSKKIRSLENEIKVILVSRQSKKVELTDAGKVFYLKAKKIVQFYSESIINVQDIDGGYRKNIRVGVGCYENYLVNYFLEDFCRANHKIKVSLFQFQDSEVFRQLLYQNLDIVLISDQFFADLNNDSYKKILLCDTEWCLALNKNNPLSSHSEIKISQIKNQVFITTYKGSITQVRDIYEGVFQQSFREITTIVNANSCDAKLTLVNANVGIGLLPSFVKTGDYKNVILKPFNPPYRHRKFYVVCLNKAYHGIIKSFMDLAAGTMKENYLIHSGLSEKNKDIKYHI